MDEYALITGASKGIGKSMALQLAKRGYNLLLVARSEEELRQVTIILNESFGVNVYFLALDLSESDAPGKVTNWCRNLQVNLSILINNAGYGIWGKFEELNVSSQLNMLDLNIGTVVELTYLLLPVLKTQKQAFVLIVSSTAAYQAVPTLTLYAASKVFILSFSRGLRYELKGSNVSVSCLCPGPTDTGFAQSAGMDALADLAAKFNMKADDVAKIGLDGMFSKNAEIVPGFLNKLSSFAARHLSKNFIERVTAALYKL